MVAEGDTLDQNIMVVSIFRDRVVLRDGSNDEQLWLSFAGGAKPAVSANRPEADGTQGQADATLVRFGKRTGKRRWVLERNAVLRYYQELLNNPDRLAKVLNRSSRFIRPARLPGIRWMLKAKGRSFAHLDLNKAMLSGRSIPCP